MTINTIVYNDPIKYNSKRIILVYTFVIRFYFFFFVANKIMYPGQLQKSFICVRKWNGHEIGLGFSIIGTQSNSKHLLFILCKCLWYQKIALKNIVFYYKKGENTL